MEYFADMSASLLDESMGLRNVANNKALYIKLLNIFLTQYTNSYEELNSAIQSGNIEEAQEINHKVKGVTLNLGLLRLGEVTKSIDVALKEDKDTSIFLDFFEAVLPATMEAISSYIE